MLLSLATIFVVVTSLNIIFEKCRIPQILAMLCTGIILGPYVLDVIDASILNISAELRQMALVIILLRAGLSLQMKDLLAIGRPAILMCFLPACFEIIGYVLVAPKILSITTIEALVMGSVIAAVSPAIIIPRMLQLMETGYGKDKKIPQLILAGASVDDVFVLIVFSSALSMMIGGGVDVGQIISLPLSILIGVLLGAGVGFIVSFIFKKLHFRDMVKVLLVISVAFLLLALETAVEGIIPFSGLLAIMTMGIGILQWYPIVAPRLGNHLKKIWVVAEIMLFVLVGSMVDINYIGENIFSVVLLLGITLFFRIVGVYCSLIKTPFTKKEKCFCMIAYLPKATVQAAIGGIPLSMGLACGPIILTVAVLSIIITAPIGAIGIDYLHPRWLTKEADGLT